VATRDQLIADWQKRLAAASSTPEEPSSRSAWLSQLRFRLYRFLLSLYGDGRWNGPTVDEVEQPHGEVVIDAQALPLAGKPAKAEGKIRAALKSVVGAQENTPPPGPLATGSDGPWVVVASTSDGLHPQRCADAIEAKGIVPRVISRQVETTVEVRERQRDFATKLIAVQRQRLEFQSWEAPRVVHVRWPAVRKTTLSGDAYVALGILAGPVGAMFSTTVLCAVWPTAAESLTYAFLAAVTLAVCVTCGITVGMIVSVIRSLR
jgi:hypothetical protein